MSCFVGFLTISLRKNVCLRVKNLDTDKTRGCFLRQYGINLTSNNLVSQSMSSSQVLTVLGSRINQLSKLAASPRDRCLSDDGGVKRGQGR